MWVSLLLLWGYCQDRGRWLLRSLSLHPKAHRLNSGKSVWICLNLMCSLHPGSFSGGMNQPGSPSPYPVLPPYPHWFHQPENRITRSDSPAKQSSFIYSCEEKIKLKLFSGHLLPKCCSHMYFIISFHELAYHRGETEFWQCLSSWFQLWVEHDKAMKCRERRRSSKPGPRLCLPPKAHLFLDHAVMWVSVYFVFCLVFWVGFFLRELEKVLVYNHSPILGTDEHPL